MQEPRLVSRNQPAFRNGLRSACPVSHCALHARRSGHACCQCKTRRFQLCNSALSAIPSCAARMQILNRLVKWWCVGQSVSPGARNLSVEIHRLSTAASGRYAGWNVASSRFRSQEPNGCWLPSQSSSPPVICTCGPRKSRFDMPTCL